MDQPLVPFLQYRERAEKCRRLALHARWAGVRRAYLNLADGYDELADKELEIAIEANNIRPMLQRTTQPE